MFKAIILPLLVSVGCAKNGSDGAIGKDGTSHEIKSITNCNKIQSGLSFTHSVTEFSNGDKLVSCSVSGSSIQVYEANFFKAVMAGASNENCMLVSDADNTASSGFWVFLKLNNGDKQARYSDVGSPSDGTTITLLASTNCVTN